MFFFFQAEDGIRDRNVTGVQTCALPISRRWAISWMPPARSTSTATYRPPGFKSAINGVRLLTVSKSSIVRGSPISRARASRSEEHTSELQSRFDLVCRLLLEKKKKKE